MVLAVELPRLVAEHLKMLCVLPWHTRPLTILSRTSWNLPSRKHPSTLHHDVDEVRTGVTPSPLRRSKLCPAVLMRWSASQSSRSDQSTGSKGCDGPPVRLEVLEHLECPSKGGVDGARDGCRLHLRVAAARGLEVHVAHAA